MTAASPLPLSLLTFTLPVQLHASTNSVLSLSMSSAALCSSSVSFVRKAETSSSPIFSSTGMKQLICENSMSLSPRQREASFWLASVFDRIAVVMRQAAIISNSAPLTMANTILFFFLFPRFFMWTQPFLPDRRP